MLFTDTSTGRKSLTTTLLILSSLELFVIINLLLYKAMTKSVQTEDLGLLLMSVIFSAIFSAIYWNKKVRISKEGLEIENESS